MTSEVTSFQNGRYQALRKLGEGGKGVVYLCQDTVLRRQIAIKVLKEEVLDEESLLRFQREVQAMASLVHPNVVTVFDIGQDPSTGSGQGVGRHFLVLELMEGGDVERLITSSPNQRLDAATTVRIGKEVAKALEHAHGHGILHRDVKPGNIWLTKQGVAKLGDFGLAYLGGGPRLTHAGMMVGSIAYMAPEVALGRQADARSDLYMLGASLYEMVTGRVPFPGDDPVRVLFAHINDLPLPPRRFAPDLPEGLEALILTLLSKDPEQRPASASEVLRALEEVEQQLQEAPAPGRSGFQTRPYEGRGEGQAAHPPTPEPRFAQPLVGREREVGLLRQRVDAALRGEGSLVFVTGEAGIGKTRLAWEVRPYARGRGFLWLEGHYPREGSIPSQPWVEAIRAFLRTAPPAMLLKTLLPYGAELARLVPEVAERLGRVPSSVPIGPEEERLRLFEALAGFFVGIAREQPLALFLDDLQWAPSLDTLHHLVRSMASERLLVVASYRDAELMEKDALARTLLALNRERLFHSLPLKRLGQGEVARMVTQTLGQEASEKLADTVYQKTEGNPFFVEEVVRYLADSGAITLGDRGWDVRESTLVQMPLSVKAVVGERLERLGEEARGVLAWASVLGREFTLPLLQEVAGLEEAQLLDAVEKALAARVLTPRPTLGQEAYAFADNQTREVLYEGVSPVRRRRYHLKAGQAIEKVHVRRLEDYHDALAHHFLEGNDLQKAVEYALKAGDRAASVYSWDRAIAHYQTALEVLEELEAHPRTQADVLEKLALSTRWGRGRGAAVHWEKALQIYEKMGDQKRAGLAHQALAQEYSLYEAGGLDYLLASIHFMAAVALLRAEGESLELARAYASAWFPGAIDLLEEGLALADRLGDITTAHRASRRLGFALVLAGDVERGLDLLHKAWNFRGETTDPSGRTESASFLFYSHLYLRDAESALYWAEQALSAANQSGLLLQQVVGSLNVAQASIFRGDPDRALSSLRLSEELAGKGGTQVVEWGTIAIVASGWVYLLLGDWERAQSELQVCLQRAREIQWARLAAWASEPVGRLYLESGDIQKAKSGLEDGLNLLRRATFLTLEVPLLTALTEVAVRDSRLVEAGERLRQAQEILARPQNWRGLVAGAQLAQGILATAEKRWQEAHEAFQKAAETNHQYHLPYEEARSLFEWGQMCLSRNGPGDRERGMELLDQALTISQRIKARKMAEKVLARKEMLRA